MKRYYLLLLFILPSFIYSQTPKREFRAAWIATVFNIDWPSRQGLPIQYQKKELLKILDTLTNLNFNAAILQVKPSSDALYKSIYSPWSKYLMGTQGVSPDYDPLEFFIQEAKKRNIETHIWLNPFRVLASGQLSSLAKSHIARKNPSWIIKYDNRYYFDPGNPDIHTHLYKEILEIVNNYDIDAIHMDDYFYPYKVYQNGSLLEFNDQKSWVKFGQNNFSNKNDWRRNNIDQFVKNIYFKIKHTKPHVQFGISPFGVWRNKSSDPKGSDTLAGQTNYDDLYADVLKWLENGWVDYILPQIYWHFDTKGVPFDTLVQWWQKNTPSHINLYIGLGVYKLVEQSWPLSYIQDQVKYLRKNNIDGMAYYSAIWLVNDTKHIIPYIKNYINPSEALIPINSRIIGIVPKQLDSLDLISTKNSHKLVWKNSDKSNTAHFIIYQFKKADNTNSYQIIEKIPTNEDQYLIKEYNPKYSYGISAVSRTHQESPILSLEDSQKLESLTKLDKILSQ